MKLKDSTSYEYVRSLGNSHHLIFNRENKTLEVWINDKHFPYANPYTWMGHIVRYKTTYNDYKRAIYNELQEQREKFALMQEAIKMIDRC
jgi:hypothetical protein